MNYPTIPPIDKRAAQQARARQNSLTKPPGSLGRLEEVSIQLAGMKADPLPNVDRKAVIIMAADHGVALEGVSAFPAEVTPQMVMNFLSGGAAINVLARQAGASVTIVDIGVAADFDPALAGLWHRKVARGTSNMAKGPAMTRADAEKALACGMDVLAEVAKEGLDLIATGEMGIGNTTPSSAIISVMTGLPVAKVTGRGTGLDDAGISRKIRVIENAIALNRPDPKNALDVLSKVGGLEIAGLAGVMIAAASRRIPVVVDGFISSAAAMIAVGLVPDVRNYLLSGHQSVEIGHQAMLRHLGLTPLIDLDLRLGEGTGAVLAFHLVEAASRILREMATFAEAGVSDKG
ncbi:MAG TPA: nicotinate-nucleotide--dimethylbenzimidazole phosphoribosyltransferase [Smithellaceae bacterium]|jgi:nicotinate-nucleotide--dimethylbenzimidazole phosphoribosyltransferase|nr:nicotinate-nucleotide--dimethylbenzimidazole phosphoribosyltransferase [Deltaproteobacteria bacterium]OQC54284.1 MAG: Nicotinate-nucleotide--dimethylbenzimidazole phosphoribosyltransferase [Deltaproteobacteria bacterium ADurb.Bin022]HOO35392.1 nicotinate-nucleotide--dimethylbenzimidazole phosphoribosyltransferase [Smithella sp.]HPK54638.1 nicotinate-nucleotide--dimethylbenzimidazole phosphoribosyltransferase [Smithellaceae bacterium]HPK22414.1 nicotinate-nucleotide--dimethylbenzimidazole pho